MKYYSKVIRRDRRVLRNKPDAKIAKLTGLSPSYISLLRRGLRVAPEKTYRKIKKSLTFLSR